MANLLHGSALALPFRLNLLPMKAQTVIGVEFFLNGVKETSAQAAQSAHQILTLFEGNRHKIERLGCPAASVLRIH